MSSSVTLSYAILGGVRLSIPGLNGAGPTEIAADVSSLNPIVAAVSIELKAQPTKTAGTITISAAAT